MISNLVLCRHVEWLKNMRKWCVQTTNSSHRCFQLKKFKLFNFHNNISRNWVDRTYPQEATLDD